MRGGLFPPKPTPDVPAITEDMIWQGYAGRTGEKENDMSEGTLAPQAGITRKDLVKWLAEIIYLRGGPSKAGSVTIAAEIADRLIREGLITVVGE